MNMLKYYAREFTFEKWLQHVCPLRLGLPSQSTVTEHQVIV